MRDREGKRKREPVAQSSLSDVSQPVSRRPRRRPPSQHSVQSIESPHVTPTTSLPSFRRGNILLIRMRNFLTFSNAVFRPGPRMNLVIGPNGSGKSTIVSAVCIALGGKPSILGRNPDLSAYVKFGCSESELDLTIYDPHEPHQKVSVRRKFSTEGPGSFFINGEPAKLSEVNRRIVSKYDIQLDNLTQFMPQEKVAEFTNHKPRELLNLAIRALGGVEREELFHELVEQDSKLQNDTAKLDRNQQSLDALYEKQRTDDEEVKMFKQQEQLRGRLMLLKKLRPVVTEIELSIAWQDQKLKVDGLTKEIMRLIADLRKVSDGPLGSLKQTNQQALASYTAVKKQAKDTEASVTNLIRASEEVSSKLVQKTGELAQVEKSAEQARRHVQNVQTKLHQAQEKLDALSDSSLDVLQSEQRDFDTQRSSLKSTLRILDTKRNPQMEKHDDAERRLNYFHSKLGSLSDIRQQRLNQRVRRQRNGQQLLECERMMRQLHQQNAFRGNVFGPVCVEIEVDDIYFARIMQHAASGYLQTAFVTESNRDTDVLLDAAKQHFRGSFLPNVISVPTTRDDEIDHEAISRQAPRRPLDESLRKLGLVKLVSDIYEAPPSVKHTLNALAGLHDIFVGDNRSIQNQEHLRYEEGLQCWYTPDTRCNISLSKYNRNARNMRVDSSFKKMSGDLYTGGVQNAEQEREAIQRSIRQYEQVRENAKTALAELQTERDDIVEKVRQVEHEITSIVDRRKQLANSMEEVTQMTQLLDSVRRKAQATNVASAKERVENEIRELEDLSVSRIGNMCDGIASLEASVLKIDSRGLARICAEQDLAIEEGKYKHFDEEIKKRKMERNEERLLKEGIKDRWRKAREEAKDSLTEEERGNFQEFLKPHMEGTSQELEEEIAKMEGEVEGLATGGQSVLAEFEHRQRKIDQLEREIEKEKESYEKVHGVLQQKREEFLAWLEGGIARMRKKFSNLYTRLGCAGDIQLDGGGKGNLRELTLKVLVSYRKDVELRQVSAMSNSGGEKMCCTMIFCFSLQLEEERIPPFVIVDELNQGLDPSNEMKIMTMMLEDASKENASQTFVVTPKLLPKLPLSTCTRTHCVFNGPVEGKEDYFGHQ